MEEQEDLKELEYSDVEVVELIQAALNNRSTLPITFLETKLYEELYDGLQNYMDRVDILLLLSELRPKLLSGFSRITPQNLHQICRSCRKCDNTSGHAIDPTWNISDPDLMIVIENPEIFRLYKDFLIASLKQVGFKSDRCMLTYATRCPIPSQDITTDNLSSCIPYLHDEISATNPKLILVLGSRIWGPLTGDVVNKISDIENSLSWIGLNAFLPGMSLAWYARSAEHAKDKQNNKLVDLLNSAHNFLYSSNS